MNKLQTFQEFLTTSSSHISILSFSINILIAILLSILLSKVYIKYGKSLSNRKQFSRNFLLLIVTTMLVISIVKSSLALSLGLVGALSIVRFRAAIKEPEELAYLFLAIGIGLGLGADQAIVTIVALILITIILYLRKKFFEDTDNDQNLHLTVHSHNPCKIELDQIIDILKKNCQKVNLKRLDENKDITEASFLIEFENIEQLNKTKNALQQLSDEVKITFLDNIGVF